DRAAALGQIGAGAVVCAGSQAHGLSRRVALWLAQRSACARRAARPDRQAVRRARPRPQRAVARELAGRSPAVAYGRSCESRTPAESAWARPRAAARRVDARRGVRAREALARGELCRARGTYREP